MDFFLRMEVRMVSCNDIMYDALLHYGERRRKRMCAYYICPVCDNQFLYGMSRKERCCPVCKTTMSMVSTVDEFELGRMDSWSCGSILRGQELDETAIFGLRAAFFYRTDIGREKKEEVRNMIISDMRKELC